MTVALLTPTSGIHRRAAQIAEGVNLQVPLSFYAQSITVDNLTGSWLYCIENGNYYPPLWRGVIESVNGLQSFTFVWQTPSMQASSPNGSFAKVSFTDEALTPNGGYPVQAQATQSTIVAVPMLAVVVGVNGFVDIVAAVAGKQITVYAWSVSLRAGTNGAYLVTMRSKPSHKIVNVFSLSLASQAGLNAEPNINSVPGGVPLPMGEGMQLFADAGNPGQIFVDGTVNIIQA